MALSSTGLLLLVLTLNADAAVAPTATIEAPGLESLLKNALSGSGQIKEAMGDVEIARSQLDRARAAVYPSAQATLIGAPIFEETGDASQSQSNFSKWGPFFTGGIQIVQPIYTFGQISGYRGAAQGQLDAKTELAEVRRHEVIYSTKEFYYGYLMATELENLVKKLSEFLEEAVKTAETEASKKRKKSEVTVKPHDVFKLKTALDDLLQKKLLAQQARRTAERAISWMSATDFTVIREKTLKPESYKELKLEECLKLAKVHRPEFKALKAGQEARASLRDAKAAQSYPVVFFGGFFSFGWSPVRQDQPSVFANDPFNNIQAGAGLGLRFDLEFARHSAEAGEQEAELMKLKATESYAAPGIELQVKKAFWEFEQAREGLVLAERRKTTANQWFVKSAMGWSIGLTPAKDLLESLQGDGEARKNYIETVYQLNIALAHLTQAIGQEVTALKYR